MKRITLALAVLVAFAFVAVANADTQFPGNSYNGVFVAAQTVNNAGTVNDQFLPGETVVFQAFAINSQIKKLLTKMSAKKPSTVTAAKATLSSFYVRIPLMDDIKFVYSPASPGVDPRYRWKATWVVPALYPAGQVHFTVFAKTWSGKSGSFSQVPIAASQLTVVTSAPQVPYGPGPNTSGSVTSSSFDMAIYADSVNGSGGTKRPTGCTQSNVYKRGEQIVPRAYGIQLSDGKLLDISNIADAHFSIAGVTDTSLNFGMHGPVGQKVGYWTGAWIVPADYPLGDVNLHFVFKNLANKTVTVDYPITIIPA